MANFEIETGKWTAEKEIATKLKELIGLFDNFPEEGVPVTTDTSGHWPPKYDNLENYDRVATDVMVALQYVDSIVAHIASPALLERISQARKDFYVSQDPQAAKTPRMIYKSEDIVRLKSLLQDIEKEISVP